MYKNLIIQFYNFFRPTGRNTTGNKVEKIPLAIDSEPTEKIVLPNPLVNTEGEKKHLENIVFVYSRYTGRIS
ncbi:MAG: hypothetical protein OEZ01_05065 [Candidatus Heimdallarchaeota archaeon]|nr:hypothetical protein [Candidatus Heimdallarchaeota archaeon]